MNKYFEHLTKVVGGVKEVARTSHRNAISLFVEFMYCFLRYGCLPRQFTIGEFWNKTANDRRDIITYRQFVKIMNQLNNPKNIHILENKAHFNTYFSDFIQREWLFSADSTIEQIESFILRHNQVIVKPYAATEGHGIYKLNAEKITDLHAEAENLAKMNVMIEELLIQNRFMIFGNTSVNTIRVHTILDKSGKGHILSCILRAGIGDTVVDNYCLGGVIYPVDVDYGIVIGKGISRVGNNHMVHPNTDTVMIGYQIPNWDILVKESIKAAELLPDIRIVGWDVAITSNGIELIEGNHNPDYELYEFIGEGKMLPKIKRYL